MAYVLGLKTGKQHLDVASGIMYFHVAEATNEILHFQEGQGVYYMWNCDT